MESRQETLKVYKILRLSERGFDHRPKLKTFRISYQRDAFKIVYAPLYGAQRAVRVLIEELRALHPERIEVSRLPRTFLQYRPPSLRYFINYSPLTEKYSLSRVCIGLGSTTRPIRSKNGKHLHLVIMTDLQDCLLEGASLIQRLHFLVS